MQVSLRSGIAALLVGALMLWRGERMSLRDGTFWPGVVVGCLFALEYLLVGVGMRLTSASHIVVFLYTAPLFAALGLLGFVLPPMADNKARWFCSEACAAALGVGDPWRFSPGALAVVTRDMGRWTGRPVQA